MEDFPPIKITCHLMSFKYTLKQEINFFKKYSFYDSVTQVTITFNHITKYSNHAKHGKLRAHSMTAFSRQYINVSRKIKVP
jgi:hypothetical protein